MTKKIGENERWKDELLIKTIGKKKQEKMDRGTEKLERRK